MKPANGISNKKGGRGTSCGVHAGGRDDHMAATAPWLHREEMRLQRRIGRFCNPEGLLGFFALSLRRRRLLRKLRSRFDAPHALYLSRGFVARRHAGE